MDISVQKPITTLKLFKKDPLKLKAKERQYFIHTLAELLNQGFSINQSLSFFKILLPKREQVIDYLLNELKKGNRFEEVLKPLGFSNKVISQLFFAQKQGRFNACLMEIASYLKLMTDYQHKLVKALLYPVILVIFLVGLLFGLRKFMLPQILTFISEEALNNQPLARWLIIAFTYLPQLTITGMALVILIYLACDIVLHKKTLIERLQLLARLPVIRKYIRSFCSYRLAEEFGYFFESGFSIQQILALLAAYPIDPLLSHLASLLEENFLKGISLTDSLKELDIFTDEFPMMVYQGEITSQTGAKCRLYAQKVFADTLEDLNNKINLIQPLLFILIAIVIIAMYLLLMLPMLTIEI